MCPTLTTCVQTDDVFLAEMQKIRGDVEFDLTERFASKTRLLDRLRELEWRSGSSRTRAWSRA